MGQGQTLKVFPGAVACLFAAVCLGVAIMKIVSLAVHTPVVGYANQFDAARTSACLSFWPDTETPTSGSTAAPVRQYRMEDLGREACYPSSETYFDGLVLSIYKIVTGADAHDIRAIGLSKGILLALFLVVFHFQLSSTPSAQLFHALAAMLVVTDPLNLLYLNTLYPEYFALFGLYAALTASACMLLRAGHGVVNWAALSIGLVTLLFSKAQHILLPGLIVLMLLPFLQWKAVRVLIPAMALFYVLQLTNLSAISNFVGNTNKYNVTMLTVAPMDARQGIEELGLGPACARYVGTSWFHPDAPSVADLCPELFSLTRVDMVAFLLARPAESLYVLYSALFRSTAVRPSYIGEVEDQVHGRLQAGTSPINFGLSYVLEGGDFTSYNVRTLAPMLFVGTLSLVLVFSTVRTRSHPSAAVWLGTASVVVCLVTFGVALIGDGYSDLTKHVHLSYNLVLLLWLLSVPVSVAFVRRYSDVISRGATVTLLSASAAISMVVPFALGKSIPAGVASLDRLEATTSGRVVNRLHLRGWVKTSHGVSSVQARIGSLVAAAGAYGPASDVDVMFPIPDQLPGKRFDIRIEDVDVSMPVFLQIEATTPDGKKLVVHERWIDR